VGNVRLRTKWNGMSSRLSCRNTSQTRNDINANSWNRNTIHGGASIKEVEVESEGGMSAGISITGTNGSWQRWCTHAGIFVSVVLRRKH